MTPAIFVKMPSESKVSWKSMSQEFDLHMRVCDKKLLKKTNVKTYEDAYIKIQG